MPVDWKINNHPIIQKGVNKMWFMGLTTYCCLQKTCQNTNKHKIGTTRKICESHISRTNSSIVSISFVFDLPISTAGPGAFSFYNLFTYPLFTKSASKFISCSLCSRFLKNYCLNPLEIFTVHFSDLEAGPRLCIIVHFYLYVDLSELPLNISTKACTDDLDRKSVV